MVVKRIHVTGLVQGVGFRPFVYQIAQRANLRGWVANTSAGVDIEIDCDDRTLDSFVRTLTLEKPPLARIDSVQVLDVAPDGELPDRFEIRASVPVAGAFLPISPDIGICPDCLHELFDLNDRRYHYPFINCTNCGPRFTIIQDIPYDRPLTTMRDFSMCADCAREYHDPLNRRFHAQPTACPKCGPSVRLEIRDSRLCNGNAAPNSSANLQSPISSLESLTFNLHAIAHTRQLLQNGHIVAIKGLGGFHLACDAMNSHAVELLRERKLRVDKPFALMMSDLAAVEQHCFVSTAERELLESPERPIVLLKRRPSSNVAQAVAPGQDTLGVMLPYTPLHYLLLADDERRTIPPTLARGREVCDPPRAPRPERNAAQSWIPAAQRRGRSGVEGPAGRDLSGAKDESTYGETESPAFVHRPSSSVLVMTSGNLSEEPIAFDNDEARERLATLADAFLMHNRPIHIRCDDSVVRVMPFQDRRSATAPAKAEQTLPSAAFALHTLPLRRARGYAPFPVRLPFDAPTLLAAGAELKNSFCITRERYAFLSHHIGDMENYETLRSFESGVEHFERLFRVQPQAIAYDLHPNYLATRYALERAEREGLPAIGVQHHHAHIASCMAEHGLAGDRRVIGVAFDGTGYGDDGAIWGGEFLLADYAGYQRAFHLAYIPMPGGDKAVRQPWRLALAWLQRTGVGWAEEFESVQMADKNMLCVLRQQIQRGVNAPRTSSMGRLFDAVAALIGVRQVVNYEAQAAIELEVLADASERQGYVFDVRDGIVDPAHVIHSVVNDLRAGESPGTIAGRFHNGVASMVRDVCMLARETYGMELVALSGGVWQNMTLLSKTLDLLADAGFKVLLHHQVPPNDGGLSLGQAAVAAKRLEIGC